MPEYELGGSFKETIPFVNSYDKVSLIEFCDFIKNMDQMSQAALIHHSMKLGIIKTPFLLKMVFKLFSKSFESKVMYHILITQNNVDLAIKSFCDHMINGKDEFDEKSAGGFSRPELNTIRETCKVIIEIRSKEK